MYRIEKNNNNPNLLHAYSDDKKNNTSEYHKYKWQDGRLVPCVHIHSSKKDDLNSVYDVYEYDENGNEVFIESGDGRLMNDYISREE